MRYLLILFFAFCTFAIYAQSTSDINSGYVQGIVVDSTTQETILQASVRLVQQTDSSYIRGTATDDNGKFKLLVTKGKYKLEISFIGYKKKIFLIDSKNDSYKQNLGKIHLQEDILMLQEAVVEAKIPDILVRGDTIEYNASAYRSDENGMLEDIIKNIPGIEIGENGSITANGKPVHKILIDGKEFFGNDMAMALSNLPANMIKKLQLFKKESDEAKITGFKDKEPEQVLNLEVEDELKQSAFGDARLGYGSDDKYNARGIINYMYDQRQLSVVGSMNNASTSEHYFPSNGIEKRKNLGVNLYNQSSEKFNIGADVRYSGNDNTLETMSNTETFLSTGDRLSKQNSTQHNDQDGLDMGMNLMWKIDSLTTIMAYTSMGVDNSRNSTRSTNLSYVQQGDTTSAMSNNLTKDNTYNISNSFTIGRQLNNKGRVVSLSLNQNYRKSDSKGNSYSETNYTDGTDQKIIDQKQKTDSKTNNYGFSLSYVEPIGKDNLLQISYSYSASRANRMRDVRKMDEYGDYSILDTAYSRNTNNTYINQNISINFQRKKEKYNYTVGMSFEPTSSKSKISLGDSIIENVKQNVVNYSPNLYFSYTPNTSTNLDFNYAGHSSQPSITQLSADTVIISAMSKYYGNPNLKPSYDNSFNVNFQKSDYEAGRFLMLSAGYNYTLNNIVDYTHIDSQGNTENTYRNVNGNMGSNLNFSFNTPFRNKKFSINTGSNVTYYKNIGFSNGEKLKTNNISLSEQLSLRFKATKIESSIQAGITHSITTNNLTSVENRKTTNYNLRNATRVKLPYDFAIQSTISYSHYGGYGADFKKSEILWNGSISKRFLKAKKGTLNLQFFDILNDRSNVSRIVNSNYISDSRTNSISRFVMLTFSYRFNLLRGKSQSNETYDYF